MDYIAPLNRPATAEEPRPAYFDGNAQTGQEGSYPSGRSLEFPMREILAVIESAGLVPTNSDLTQLLQAINQIIAAALAGFDPGGEGDPPAPVSFLLNPVYPTITVNGGLMAVATDNAEVSIPAGQTFVHRGGVAYSSSDTLAGARTFATVASKTYHLRWRYNGGAPAFGLFDVADAGYNPGGADETNPVFDSSFDDMLIARVATDAANNPVATALLNRHRLALSEILTGTDGKLVGANGANFRFQKTLNWARTPATQAFHPVKMNVANNVSDADRNTFAFGGGRTTNGLVDGNAPAIPLTRYGLDAVASRDGANSLYMNLSCGA